MLTKRTNILFDNQTWLKLQRLAKTRNESIGELVRQAVEQNYNLKDDQTSQIRQVCDEIERIRVSFKGKLDYKALINYGRKF
jgi:hypothetical protein